MFAPMYSKPALTEKPRGLSKSVSSNVPETSAKTARLSDLSARRIHTPAGNVENEPRPRKLSTVAHGASRPESIRAKQSTTLLRENGRHAQPTINIQAQSAVKGRISDVTRRRMEQRAAVPDNRQLSKSTSDSRMQPKRIALGEVVNSETGRPIRASKRIKSEHVHEDQHNVKENAVMPSKRVKPTQPSKPYSTSKSKLRSGGVAREPTTLTRMRKSTTAIVSLPQYSLPTVSLTPDPYYIRISQIAQMHQKQMLLRPFGIRTPESRITRDSYSRFRRFDKCAPGAPKCKKRITDHVTPEPAIFTLESSGANSQELNLIFLPEYAEEIYAFLRFKEDSTSPDPSYVGSAIQPELTWEMRRVLVNWIVQLHAHFALAPETFYLTINIMDRFLGKRTVLLHNFHLVAVCALMLASKYEQHFAPDLQSLVTVCEGQYTNSLILTAERYIVVKLQYELSWPNPLTFMRRINQADGFDPRHRMLAKYLMELAQLEQRLVGVKPSVLAAAAYLAACQILNTPWTQQHTRLANYCPEQLVPYVHALLECCYAHQDSAIGEKYAQDAYYKISRTLPDYLDAAGYTYLGCKVMRS